MRAWLGVFACAALSWGVSATEVSAVSFVGACDKDRLRLGIGTNERLGKYRDQLSADCLARLKRKKAQRGDNESRQEKPLRSGVCKADRVRLCGSKSRSNCKLDRFIDDLSPECRKQVESGRQ